MAVVIAFPQLSSDENSILRAGAAQPPSAGTVRRARQALRNAILQPVAPLVEKLGLMEYWRTTKPLPDLCETEDVPFCRELKKAATPKP